MPKQNPTTGIQHTKTDWSDEFNPFLEMQRLHDLQQVGLLQEYPAEKLEVLVSEHELGNDGRLPLAIKVSPHYLPFESPET